MNFSSLLTIAMIFLALLNLVLTYAWVNSQPLGKYLSIALYTLCGLSIIRWISTFPKVLTDDANSFGFIAVHAVLGAVSISLAIASALIMNKTTKNEKRLETLKP